MAEKIKAADLIEKFRQALDDHWGYIWGTAGIKWTQARQTQKVNYMVEKYGADWKKNADAKNDNYYMCAVYGSKWIGHTVADCSGMFVWAYAQYGLKIAHISTTIYTKYCGQKGQLTEDLKKSLQPGAAVFTGKSANNHPHVGLYVGGGKVIEAHGTQAGVITSNLSETRWTWYGYLNDVEYENQPGPAPEPEPKKGYAIVTGKRVALREDASTRASIIMRIDTGETVKLEPEPDEWDYVSYKGKKGWMMKKFLKEGD